MVLKTDTFDIFKKICSEMKTFTVFLINENYGIKIYFLKLKTQEMGLITEWIQKKSNKGSKVENKVWKYRKEECRAKTRLTGCILNKNEEK